MCKGMPASGLWLEPQSRWHINRLELGAVFLVLKDFRPQLKKRHVLIRTKHVCGFVHKSPRRRMIQGSVQACSKSPAMGGPSLSPHQSSAHPRSSELGVDILSRKGIPQGEWRLHPESVRMIWTRYGRAEVDLFTTSKNAHCPLFFSLSHSPLKGDALTSHWPAARLYAFPPINILPLVLCKIREEGASVILIAPNWPDQPWFPDLTELLVALPNRSNHYHSSIRPGIYIHVALQPGKYA